MIERGLLNTDKKDASADTNDRIKNEWMKINLHHYHLKLVPQNL